MDSSRKRSRQASERDELPPWECDPSYGIVHPSGCNICRSYMSHVSQAKAAQSAPILRAFREQDKQLDTYFLDGIVEGRRRQRTEDQDNLRDLERSRNDAASNVSRLRSECRETAQQLLQVTNELRLAQSERDALRKRFKPLTNQKVDTTSHNSQVDVDMMLLVPQDIDVKQTPTDVLVPSSILHSKPEDSSGSSVIPPNSVAPATALSSSSLHEASSRIISTANLPQRPTVEVIASSRANEPHATSTSSSRSIRTPKTVRQLQYLMDKAHEPGNEDYLAKVKDLCSEAHLTPREKKTELQRYILHNWRNPEPAATSAPLLLPVQESLQLRANNPRVDDPVEVWHAYLTMHRGSWPRGVRCQADGTPHLGDLKASRTVARLRPAIDANGDSTARNEFMACAVQLFASPGMYKDLLRRNALSVAPVVTYKPYRVTQFSVTATEVARHFAAAGVTVEESVAELEPWAQEYQAAFVYPTGSAHTKPSNGYRFNKSPSVYRYRSPARPYDQGDRFGWR
ncbi:hypothetical protein GGX14DRAFT_365957 [Mycena pura]|uniref:Uncharacterized protein n=1 Tax=Mycena pura TaxID=153505 RepID=A0AAD6YFY0_9AGAR|nr:hypothetical protein GGX14DRAFT_365957 [Mycena pura]